MPRSNPRREVVGVATIWQKHQIGCHEAGPNQACSMALYPAAQVPSLLCIHTRLVGWDEFFWMGQLSQQVQTSIRFGKGTLFKASPGIMSKIRWIVVTHTFPDLHKTFHVVSNISSPSVSPIAVKQKVCPSQSQELPATARASRSQRRMRTCPGPGVSPVLQSHLPQQHRDTLGREPSDPRCRGHLRLCKGAACWERLQRKISVFWRGKFAERRLVGLSSTCYCWISTKHVIALSFVTLFINSAISVLPLTLKG